MDFLTGLAYWGILLLVVVNAVVVLRMKVRVDLEHDENEHAENGQKDRRDHEGRAG